MARSMGVELFGLASPVRFATINKIEISGEINQAGERSSILIVLLGHSLLIPTIVIVKLVVTSTLY